MSARPLEILVALTDAEVAASTASALRRRGHVVALTADLEQALQLCAVDVVVCDLEFLGALRRRGARARAVVVDLAATTEAFRTALRMGACDVLARPWRLTELVDSVEAGPRAPLPAAGDTATLRRSLAAEADAVEDALRELAAFLVRRGVSPTTRMRVTSACAELLDNALRHAYGPGLDGRVVLEAGLDALELTLAVSDQGRGFDRLAAGPRDLPPEGGLARAAALAEDLRLESAPDRGTRVELRFTAYRVEFDESETPDLSELDWLPPALARRVLASLSEGHGEPPFNLSPSLAVVIGRLLAGATSRQRAERALWI